MTRSDEAALEVPGAYLETQGERSRTGWVAAGGVLGAIGASSCCIVPLVLFSLGAGGVWIGNLTALAPYQPIFIAVTALQRYLVRGISLGAVKG